MTPIRKFIKKETSAVKPRTPLGVLNRRSKSAESLSQKQSRIQQNVAGNKVKIYSNENQEFDENFTPKSKNIMNKNQTTNKRSQSRIPIFKKIN